MTREECPGFQSNQAVLFGDKSILIVCFCNWIQGEKLLGSLGGIFSKTWKPKKTRSVTGPVITKGLLSLFFDSSLLRTESFAFYFI